MEELLRLLERHTPRAERKARAELAKLKNVFPFEGVTRIEMTMLKDDDKSGEYVY